MEGFENNGTSNLTVEYRDPDNNLICSDTVTYTLIAAVCGRQPTPSERSTFQGWFPHPVHCEWSITAEATRAYNCIAWSVGNTEEWIWWQVDEDYGDNDGVIEISDFDAFYDAKGYQIASGLTDATIMLYQSATAESPDNPDGITHAAKKRACSCGAGKWTIYESKCGPAARIEHVYNELNDHNYGAPFRYYKPK